MSCNLILRLLIRGERRCRIRDNNIILTGMSNYTARLFSFPKRGIPSERRRRTSLFPRSSSLSKPAQRVPTASSSRLGGPPPRLRAPLRRAAGGQVRSTNYGKMLLVFGKMLLVFGCIGSDFCKKICVLQHFSKSTRLSSRNF